MLNPEPPPQPPAAETAVEAPRSLEPAQPSSAPSGGTVAGWRRYASAVYIAIGVAGAITFFLAMGALNYYNIPFIIKTLPSGVGPCETSLEFTTYTFFIGMGFAFGLGMIRAHPPRRRDAAARRKKARGRFSFLWQWPLYGFATGYVSAVRGTPFLVQMYIVSLAITLSYPTFTFLHWNQFYWSGFVALLINTTGYQAEAFRGGIQSVEAGQIEGAKAVGLSRVQIFFRITLPQTLRLITLPLTNEWISNFKTATILSYISIVEVYYWSSVDIALLDAKPIEAFVMLTIFYLIINVSLSRAITYVEKVRRIPGLGTPIPEVSYAKRIVGGARAKGRGSGTTTPPTGTAEAPSPLTAGRRSIWD